MALFQPICRVDSRLLFSAYTTAEDLYGSATLSLKAEDHRSWSWPSLGMTGPLLQYCQTGQLPASGTVCSPNERPFRAVTNYGDAGEPELLDNRGALS